MCIFDKWLRFYTLIGNRNNTSETQVEPQVPAQTRDEKVSNERERLLDKKKKNAGGSWEKSQKAGTRETFILEDGRSGLLGLESRRKQLPLWGPEGSVGVQGLGSRGILKWKVSIVEYSREAGMR